MTTPESSTIPNVLVLSIQKQHVDRIVRGEKKFELRKQLPREPFEKVFLYESGGGGLVGYFDVAGVIRLPVEALWERVGERGTTRERFEAYFAERKDGCAIEIAAYHPFEQPLSPVELRERVGFAPPQSYALARSDAPLGQFLLRLAKQSGPRATSDELFLRDIRPNEHQLYAALVQREISKHYDEIDASFAKANIATAQRGDDPFALLTRSKQVLSIERIDGIVLGFTTLTFKLGGSVKSGPTVLLPEHRRHGYGARVRQMLEAIAVEQGARKIYATAADVSDAVLGYLLRSGMTVEAHLKAQYSLRHGEIILGKILSPVKQNSQPGSAKPSSQRAPSFQSRAGQVVRLKDLSASESAQAVMLGLSSYGVRVTKQRAREIARNMGLETTYDRKPRELLALRSSSGICAGMILSAKRGGSMRGVLGTDTSHRGSLTLLLQEAEALAASAKRRKLYFLHDPNCPLRVETLRELGYVVEGTLREPYATGQDLVVVSKFLSDQAYPARVG